MNTETNDHTATDAVETIETEEATVPATDEVASTTELTLTKDDDTVHAVDMEADQEDEQADDYDPADRLFGDNAPTASIRKPVSNSKKLGTLGLIMLTLFGIFGIGFIGNAVVAYTDARWETDCISGQRVEARIASDFDGNLKAWKAQGNKVTELGPCDNIAWQR